MSAPFAKNGLPSFAGASERLTAHFAARQPKASPAVRVGAVLRSTMLSRRAAPVNGRSLPVGRAVGGSGRAATTAMVNPAFRSWDRLADRLKGDNDY